MAGTEASAERYRYLSLGFFAQRIVSALVRFAEIGETERLEDTLTEAIQYLQGLDEPHGTSGPRSFRSYQEVRTLEDVSDSAERADVVRWLEALRDHIGQPPSAELSQAVDTAITWFAQLQDEALRNYADVNEPTPRAVRELDSRHVTE